MTDIPPHLLWLQVRYGASLSAALADREGVYLLPGVAISAFASADPTPGFRLTDWLVRTYVEQATFKLEDVQAGPESTVGTTLALFVAKRGTLPANRRNINLYASPGALWKAVGGDVVPKPSKRAERDRARAESQILVEDGRGIVAVPLTEHASCWWGRGTRWCTAAREDNAFADYAENGILFVMVLPNGDKAQLHVSGDGCDLKDAADNNMSVQTRDDFKDLLDPIIRWSVDIAGDVLRFGSDTLRQDRHVILRAFRKCMGATMNISPSLYGDDDFMTAVVIAESWMFKHASSRLRDDKNLVLEVVRQNGELIGLASRRLQGDPQVALEAVRSSPHGLRHVAEILKSDRAFVLEAVTHFGSALMYASPELKINRAIVLAAVANDGMALQHTNPDMLEDKEIVLVAVKQNGCALQHASEGMWGDKDVVMAAVKQNGFSLVFGLQPGSVDMRDDMEVVLSAIANSKYAFSCASERLQADPRVVAKALSLDGLALRYLKGAMAASRDNVLAAVATTGAALIYAPLDLRCDRDVVLTAVRQDGRALEYTDDLLRGDREIVLEAVKHNGEALGYASPDLMDDPEIVMAAIRNSSWALRYAGSACRDHKAIALQAVGQCASMRRFISRRLQQDKDILALPSMNVLPMACSQDFSNMEWSPVKPSTSTESEATPMPSPPRM